MKLEGKAEAGRRTQPFAGYVKGFRLYPVGKWDNGRIKTGRINPVSGK